MKIEKSDLLALDNLSRALSKAAFNDFTIEEMQALFQAADRTNQLRKRMREELNKPETKPQRKKSKAVSRVKK